MEKHTSKTIEIPGLITAIGGTLYYKTDSYIKEETRRPIKMKKHRSKKWRNGRKK